MCDRQLKREDCSLYTDAMKRAQSPIVFRQRTIPASDNTSKQKSQVDDLASYYG